MPEQTTLKRARAAKRAGRAPSTQAGEFVREEMDHIREGKHGARSTKQAIAIGLSKARRAGVPLKPPRKGQTSRRTRGTARSAHALAALTGAELGRVRGGSGSLPAPRVQRVDLASLQTDGRQAVL